MHTACQLPVSSALGLYPWQLIEQLLVNYRFTTVIYQVVRDWPVTSMGQESPTPVLIHQTQPLTEACEVFKINATVYVNGTNIAAQLYLMDLTKTVSWLP